MGLKRSTNTAVTQIQIQKPVQHEVIENSIMQYEKPKPRSNSKIKELKREIEQLREMILNNTHVIDESISEIEINILHKMTRAYIKQQGKSPNNQNDAKLLYKKLTKKEFEFELELK